MTLPNALANIQTLVLGIGGIRSAPNKVTEGANVFPFAVSYMRSGRLELPGAGYGRHFHIIYTEIHVARQILPKAISLATSFIEPFFAAVIADPNLGGSVQEIIGVRYTFGRLEWSGMETLGMRFELDVKLNI